MHYHEAAATDVAGPGQCHRQREADRYGCVYGIAAFLQDLKPDPGCPLVLAHHHDVASGRHLRFRNASALFDEALLKGLLGPQR